MDQYKEYFGNRELGSNTGMFVSHSLCCSDADCNSIFMIYTIGNMVGSLFVGPICDKWGRRAGMMAGSVMIMIGAIVQTAAKNDDYLIAGRFVLGFGVAIGTSSAPTYAMELAPPHWRARVVGYYNTCTCPIASTFDTCPDR